MAIGRPTTYSDEIAGRICDEIAAGRSVPEICEAEDMPAPRTVFVWLEKHPEFVQRYARAREAQADLMDQMILKTASAEPGHVIVEDEDGTKTKYSVDGAEVQHRRLKIDALKWRAAHLAPKKYGTQRQEVEHSGKVSVENLICSVVDKAKDQGKPE